MTWQNTTYLPATITRLLASLTAALFVPSFRGVEHILLLTGQDGLVVWDRVNCGTAGL
jgi:hypothetical protein